eukprot:363570-Chlamydomonas_euryale.AAC.15
MRQGSGAWRRRRAREWRRAGSRIGGRPDLPSRGGQHRIIARHSAADAHTCHEACGRSEDTADKPRSSSSLVRLTRPARRRSLLCPAAHLAGPDTQPQQQPAASIAAAGQEQLWLRCIPAAPSPVRDARRTRAVPCSEGRRAAAVAQHGGHQRVVRASGRDRAARPVTRHRIQPGGIVKVVARAFAPFGCVFPCARACAARLPRCRRRLCARDGVPARERARLAVRAAPRQPERVVRGKSTDIRRPHAGDFCFMPNTLAQLATALHGSAPLHPPRVHAPY